MKTPQPYRPQREELDLLAKLETCVWATESPWRRSIAIAFVPACVPAAWQSAAARLRLPADHHQSTSDFEKAEVGCAGPAVSLGAEE